MCIVIISGMVVRALPHTIMKALNFVIERVRSNSMQKADTTSALRCSAASVPFIDTRSSEKPMSGAR